MIPKIRPSWLVGITTVGNAWLTTANPSAIRFPRVNADNSVSYLTDTQFRIAIGAGTGSGSINGNVGPITNRIVISDGITGTEVKGSAVTLDASGNITTAGTVQNGGLFLPPADLNPGNTFSITNPTGDSLLIRDTTGGVTRVEIPDSGDIEFFDFVVVAGLESSDDISTDGVIQTGGTSTLAYSRLGTGTTSHSLNGPEDLLVSGDAEVNGQLFVDNKATFSGTATAAAININMLADPSAPGNGDMWYDSANLVYQGYIGLGAVTFATLERAQTFTNTNTFNGNVAFDKTITPGGTTGAQVINKNAGSVNFAAGAASLVVTNSRVTANSIIQVTVRTNDVDMQSAQVIGGSGSFTIFPQPSPPSAETRVDFLIIN